MLKAKQIDLSLTYADEKLRSYIDAPESPIKPNPLNSGRGSLEVGGAKPSVAEEGDGSTQQEMDYKDLLGKCSSLKQESKK